MICDLDTRFLKKGGIKLDTLKLFNRDECKASKIVGQCNSRLHPGPISISLLRSHGCLEKNCKHFEKRNETYWKQRDQECVVFDKKAADIAQKQAVHEAKIAKIKRSFNENKHVYVTCLREESSNVIFISYIYDKPVDVSKLIRHLETSYKIKLKIKAVGGREDVFRALKMKYQTENSCFAT